MTFDVFFNFDGDCRQAMEFYAKVFRTEIQDVMTYSDAPGDSGYPIPEADKNRIIYANLPIFGCNVMFSDVPTGSEYVKGSNICPTLGTSDKAEIRRLFHELSEDGQVEMDLAATFWSELFGMVTDKYGIIWQLSHTKEA